MIGNPPDHVPPPDPLGLLLAAAFDTAHVTALRGRVGGVAHEYGLTAAEAGDFVTAVNEVMTNAVRHGGGAAQLRLWANGALTCEVCDQGPGFAAAQYINRQQRPTPSSGGGMGLWIAQQTSDTLSIESGPTGTTVRITAVQNAPQDHLDSLR